MCVISDLGAVCAFSDPSAEADRASLGGREHLGELGEAGLKELVTIATLVHANSLLEAVLQ